MITVRSRPLSGSSRSGIARRLKFVRATRVVCSSHPVAVISSPIVAPGALRGIRLASAGSWFSFRKERPQAALIAWMSARGRTTVSDKTGTLTIGVAASSET